MIRAIAVAGLVASFAASAADIQKCADANGNITYQDVACPRGSTIGTLPRESAHGDPAALRQLERERERLARAADAQIAQQRQEAPPVIVVPQMPQPQQPASGAQQAGAPVYTAPVYSVDPSTGALTVPGLNGVPQVIQLPAQLPSAQQAQQPATQLTSAPQPSTITPLSITASPITQPPAQVPSSITQVPSAQTSTAVTPLPTAPAAPR